MIEQTFANKARIIGYVVGAVIVAAIAVFKLMGR